MTLIFAGQRQIQVWKNEGTVPSGSSGLPGETSSGQAARCVSNDSKDGPWLDCKISVQEDSQGNTGIAASRSGLLGKKTSPGNTGAQSCHQNTGLGQEVAAEQEVSRD